ncbi:MBL fold metallo-hydrolase [Deinococcus metallilatus]|uniref:MBL fold metallo-hydrolase n=1 Tax=Deinococcus metallilatus TaxID=1211322 RepID=A0AAJ5F204_9DEIO|nr:MBL fold metallo-hydrolase [Deinococcus metallilatus]MBB5297160.1 metallo-beta-lactamase family protein [Deinococcus metallilatus]QBY10055.1 MBL fold metallo-hydrolase [Deinococcus metallilatus]RXJ08310.1 MBL fold metallo-hydrolase [Deinococcus metallilatus]TLK21980.1 MBL fold metallo-hydrolase [Deinococcus metallilatus]GMA17275.1 cleavage protein [Deinococcus metallilatus]
MRVESLGAALTVTGSAHLLSTRDGPVLIDCGLFQGGEELEARNREPFPFDAADLLAVVVTHAHLDHIGRLPLLVKRGYRGPVYCTPPTAALAEAVLLDSARLQVEGFRQDLRRARRVGREAEVPEPLYDEEDVHRTLALLRPALHYGERAQVGPLKVTAERAGHILGSAYLVIEVEGQRLLMSGDLGNRESGLQLTFTPPPPVDAVMIETTYANRIHRSREATLAEFRDILHQSIRAGGKILIPTFAIERAQMILYILRNMMEAGEVPRIPIFLDSPLAARATGDYFEFGDELIPPVREALQSGEDPFRPSTLHVVLTSTESQRINRYDGPAIIMAGSGMMNGGRIQHHLKHNLWKPSTSLVIASYQSPGSLGGRIVAGESPVHILGEEIIVRAHVHTIGGFSAHADQDDLLAFLSTTGTPRVWLIHGEVPAMEEFLPVLAQRGLTGNIMPDHQEVDLLTTTFPAGRPPGLPESHEDARASAGGE